MAKQPSVEPSRSGLSLYANLLKPNSTISNDPVHYDGANASSGGSQAPAAVAESRQQYHGQKQQQLSSAALQFQPSRRPQAATNKTKARQSLVASSQIRSASANANEATKDGEQSIGVGRDDVNPGLDSGPGSTQAKTSLADWTKTDEAGDEDNEYGYIAEKRQRGGRKKRKKNREDFPIEQNWDDIYDPSRPNTYDTYRDSDERYMEMRDWKDRLYAHRLNHQSSHDTDSDRDERPAQSFNAQFRPPSDFSAPSDPPPPLEPHAQHAVDNAFSSSNGSEQVAPSNLPPIPLPPPISAPFDALAQNTSPFSRPMPTHDQLQPLPPPPPPPSFVPPPPGMEPMDSSDQRIPPQMNPQASSTISRAPIRYDTAATPDKADDDAGATETMSEQTPENVTGTGDDSNAEDVPRSLRPGQKGFAERLMTKYGWSKGSGLGADGSGITAPLRVQVAKQKKKPDSEGGGFATPGGMGKIIAAKPKSGKMQDLGADGIESGPSGAKEGKFGAMSQVIVAKGMISSADLVKDDQAQDGRLVQGLGEEFGIKYGRVERIFIHRASVPEPLVFVKFTSQLSALRAVNALDQEGQTDQHKNEPTIHARFFDLERFESGKYV